MTLFIKLKLLIFEVLRTCSLIMEISSYTNSVSIRKLNGSNQSCKSGRAFRVGLGFGPGSGLTFRTTSGLFRARYDACE